MSDINQCEEQSGPTVKSSVGRKKPVPTPRKLSNRSENAAKLTYCASLANPKVVRSQITNSLRRRVKSLGDAANQIREDLLHKHNKVKELVRSTVPTTTTTANGCVVRLRCSKKQDNVENQKTPEQQVVVDGAANIEMVKRIEFSFGNIVTHTDDDNDDSDPDNYESLANSCETASPVDEEHYKSVTGSCTKLPPPGVNHSSCSMHSTDLSKQSYENVIITNNTVKCTHNDDGNSDGSQEAHYSAIHKSTESSSALQVDNSLETMCSETPSEVVERSFDGNICYEKLSGGCVKRPTQSVILEFDPLLLALVETDAESYDTLSVASPPPPPIRVDSLNESEPVALSKCLSEINIAAATPANTVNGGNDCDANSSSVNNGWLKSVKDIFERGALTKSSKEQVLNKPKINTKRVIHKKGMLYKVQSGAIEDIFGEYSGRWCILQSNQLTCYSDSSARHIKENLFVDHILSIQVLLDPKCKYRYDNSDLHCFKITLMRKNKSHVYGSRDISERRNWMRCLAENLSSQFSTRITTDYVRMGWVYTREGITGNWIGSWLIMCNRNLYYSTDEDNVNSIDLRKVRCITTQNSHVTDKDPATNDNGPNIIIHTCEGALYVRVWTEKELRVWCHLIKIEVTNNGGSLHEQQLNKNDIPVVVEKCINFIYTHGSMSEGIYRRAGANSSVSDILTEFRKNAWDMQLSSDAYTEHDVANALKRFFRDLPEPLFDMKLLPYFLQALESHVAEKFQLYKLAMKELSAISYNTTKILLKHLHYVSVQCVQNLMTPANLAAIWAPTLMHFHENNSRDLPPVVSNGNNRETQIIAELITAYKEIFTADPSEIEQEQRMMQVLQRHSIAQAASNSKRAGDLHVWIYLHNKDGKTFNLLINPNKSAYDVCSEIASTVGVPSHSLTLKEVILNRKLDRPIHRNEKLLDVVLKWSYWSESDRKDNHIVATYLTLIDDLCGGSSTTTTLSDELKFADSKSRTFKSYTFKLTETSLDCYRNVDCTSVVNSWKLDKICVYFGNDTKRNPDSKWTITFIEDNYASKHSENAYFGNVIVWNDSKARSLWYSHILNSKYGENLVQLT